MAKKMQDRSKEKKGDTKNFLSSAAITKHIPLICALLLLILVFVLFLGRFAHIQDDAFITFRYVKNFAANNGLVFNVGERVEGYTNFLWLVVLIALDYVKISYVEFASHLSSVFAVLILMLTYFISRQTDKNSEKPASGIFPNLIPVFLLVFSPSFAYWAVSGMESMLFIFLFLSAVYYYLKKDNRTSINYYTPVFLALAALTRPEGIYLWGIIYLHKFIGVQFSRKEIFSKNNLIEVAIFLVPVLMHTTFRLFYYGYLFPNTFYAKASFDSTSLQAGLLYFWVFCQNYLLYGFVLVLPLFLLTKKEYRGEVTLFFTIVAFYSLYVISIGGDVLPLHRFWLPILPIIYVYFGKSLVAILALMTSRKYLSSRFAFGIIVMVVLGTGFANYQMNNARCFSLSQKEVSFVESLKKKAAIVNGLEEALGKRLTVAMTTIGAFSYYTEANVIDMLGLTDAYIAHHPLYIAEVSNDKEVEWKEKKYNADYILSRKPDYIFFSTGVKPSAFCERALFMKNEFFNNYYLQFVPLTSSDFQFLFCLKTENLKKLYNPNILKAPISYEFVKNYINLYDQIKAYQKEKMPEQLLKIQNQFARVDSLAPSFFAEHYTVTGGLFWGINKVEDAKNYFELALLRDSLNATAIAGLSTYYYKINDEGRGLSYMKTLERHGMIITKLFQQ